MPPHHSVASPPPLRTLRSLLAGTLVPATLWLRSPLERGHILFPDHANLHGWHVTPGIVYQFSRVHIATVAEARSDLLLPSDPVSQHRTGIVSSSLDPGSPAERISSSLALCPTFDLASALSSGSNFGWSLFFCASRQAPDRPANLHGSTSHCAFVSRHQASDTAPRTDQRRSWRRSSKVRCFG